MTDWGKKKIIKIDKTQEKKETRIINYIYINIYIHKKKKK